MFHSYTDFKNNLEIYRYLLDLRKSGIISKIGISIYENDELKDIINNFQNFDVIQLPFNLLDNSKKREKYLINAKKYGFEIHARSVFLQGLFFKELSSIPNCLKNLKKELSYLKSIAVKFNLEMVDLALNYVLNKPYIDKVLIGVDSLKHLKMKQRIKTLYILQ